MSTGPAIALASSGGASDWADNLFEEVGSAYGFIFSMGRFIMLLSSWELRLTLSNRRETGVQERAASAHVAEIPKFNLLRCIIVCH
jgi:hypothetical protein